MLGSTGLTEVAEELPAQRLSRGDAARHLRPLVQRECSPVPLVPRSVPPPAQTFPLHWQMVLSGLTETFILFHPEVFGSPLKLNLSLNPARRWTRHLPRPSPGYVIQRQSSDAAMDWTGLIHANWRSCFNPAYVFLWWPLLIPYWLTLKSSAIKKKKKGSFCCPSCMQDLFVVVLWGFRCTSNSFSNKRQCCRDSLCSTHALAFIPQAVAWPAWKYSAIPPPVYKHFSHPVMEPKQYQVTYVMAYSP